ncbi:Protein saal1 [Desmophyllum pertusum]|uniref:Protein saal1 n=1 Tax=Desmophyllum pertusum TaxID=174260 RepID=A0A9X0D8R5_9CNID|nr:Protein saal1 [Desmophyllum pertusum]
MIPKMATNMASPREGERSHELSDAFERELCELWDMSMNADVAAFLEEMETTEVLLDAVLKSQNARVTEFVLVILANMACSHDVCVKMMRNRDLVLIHVCLSNDEVESQWMAVLETENSLQELQLHFGELFKW